MFVTFSFPDDNVSFLGPTVLKLHILVAYGRGMLGIAFGFKRSKVKITIYRSVCYVLVSGRYYSNILIVVVRMKVVHVLKSASIYLLLQSSSHFQIIWGEEPQTPLPKLSVTPYFKSWIRHCSGSPVRHRALPVK
jgi:hypothetical protein